MIGDVRALESDQIQDRFHDRKVKKLHLHITRYAASPNKKRQREVKKKGAKLIAQVERIVTAAEGVAKIARTSSDLSLWATGAMIDEYLPKIRKVIGPAKRTWINGEKVPACDRIFSIFEDHVELIKRGRRQKPVEFGHALLLGQTREKFITQYEVMEKKIPDCQLPETVLEKYIKTFGSSLPKGAGGRRGFCRKRRGHEKAAGKS